MEAATGKCHLRVTRKRKPNRTAAVVAIQALVIHVVALLSPAHSLLCQPQLLYFHPLHQNIKSVDFYFFGSKFHLGQSGQIPQALQQRGSSELHSLCFTSSPHPLSVSPQHTACRGCSRNQLCQGWGVKQMPCFIPGAAQGAPTKHSPLWLHLSWPASRGFLAGHTTGSRTRAGLLSRTSPPMEQFHQHRVIQFHFCTSWVYLARRETSSLLSSC